MASHAPLTHMTSTLINWKAIRATLKPLLAIAENTYKAVEQKTGRTPEQNTAGLLRLNFDNCKTAEDILNVIHNYYNYDMSEEEKFRILAPLRDHIARNNGVFDIRKYLASGIIVRALPLEDKMKLLFMVMDANGDGYLDANELFVGFTQFFIGMLRVVKAVIDNNIFALLNVKDVNVEEVKEAINQVVEVYTDDKVKSIVDKCIEAASTNKTSISYQEWINWFPLGAPDAFGSAKILFDP